MAGKGSHVKLLTRRGFSKLAGMALSAALVRCVGEIGSVEATGAAGDAPVDDPSVDPSPNGPPSWTTIPNLVLTPGSTVSVAGYVTDPDGDALTFAIESGTLPPGVIFDAAALCFIVAADAPTDTTAELVLSADDGRG
jgi:hypothetical protein